MNKVADRTFSLTRLLLIIDGSEEGIDHGGKDHNHGPSWIVKRAKCVSGD